MSTSAIERRKHSRLELKAYGFKHRCRLHSNGSALDLYLIDISPGGARVKMAQPGSRAPEMLAAVVFDTLLNASGARLNGLESTVRWHNGEEFGLRFERELELASSDLQALLAP